MGNTLAAKEASSLYQQTNYPGGHGTEGLPDQSKRKAQITYLMKSLKTHRDAKGGKMESINMFITALPQGTKTIPLKLGVCSVQKTKTDTILQTN